MASAKLKTWPFCSLCSILEKVQRFCVDDWTNSTCWSSFASKLQFKEKISWLFSCFEAIFILISSSQTRGNGEFYEKSYFKSVHWPKTATMTFTNGLTLRTTLEVFQISTNVVSDQRNKAFFLFSWKLDNLLIVFQSWTQIDLVDKLPVWKIMFWSG